MQAMEIIPVNFTEGAVTQIRKLMDEPGFDACSEGVTVRVGRKCRSKARYRLSSVAQVQKFLQNLGRDFA